MIEVASITEGLRKEGLGFGVPMTFLTLGLGEDYPKVDTLVGQVVRNSRCRWVCINGEDTIRTGVGTLVSGLVKCDLRVELDYSGKDKTPSWLLNADRWVVDYHEESSFHYMEMRSSDMVRFKVKADSNPTNVIGDIERGLKSLKNYTGTKYILIDPGWRSNQLFMREVFEIIVGEERCRIY